jgi:hypothetical protein
MISFFAGREIVRGEEERPAVERVPTKRSRDPRKKGRHSGGPLPVQPTTPSSGRRANSRGLHAPATCSVPLGPNAIHPGGRPHAHRADSHRLRACASTPVPHTRSPLRRSPQKRPASLQPPLHLNLRTSMLFSIACVKLTCDEREAPKHLARTNLATDSIALLLYDGLLLGVRHRKNV